MLNSTQKFKRNSDKFSAASSEKKKDVQYSIVEYGQISMGWPGPGLYAHMHVLSVCVCVYAHVCLHACVHAKFKATSSKQPQN